MFDRVVAYLSTELDIPAEEITRETTFDSLQLDSLDTVEMVMALEDELGIELDAEEKISTVGELVDFIESRFD